MSEKKIESNGMEKEYKGKWKRFWGRVMADAKMDNATKARIAEETVQDITTGLENLLNPDFAFERTERAMKEEEKK